MYYRTSEIKSLSLTRNQDFEPAFKVELKPGAVPCSPEWSELRQVVLVSGEYGYLHADDSTVQDYRDFILDFRG